MSQFSQIISLCRKHKSFLITTHQNPDADAVASALAMGVFLRSIGKRVVVVNEDVLPRWLEFLPHTNLFKQYKAATTLAYDAAIVVDCGDMKRTGAAARLIDSRKPLVNIDHHITNDNFGDINLVKPSASSTCEIIYDLLRAAKVGLTKSLATLLYAGIMTDTGSFRYENTTDRTHVIAADLMRHGLKAQSLYERLYVGAPVKDMSHLTGLLHSAQLYLGQRVYCVSLSAKQAKAFSKNFDLKEKVFAFLRGVEGVEVVVILSEVDRNETRINLRSRDSFDVAKLAMGFQGGGHQRAAGGIIKDNVKVARVKVVAAIARQMKQG